MIDFQKARFYDFSPIYYKAKKESFSETNESRQHYICSDIDGPQIYFLGFTLGKYTYMC